MDVVVRGVNQRFLDEVAFPFLAQSAADLPGALQRLAASVGDPAARARVEGLLERRADGTWSAVQSEGLREVAYELVFSEWQRTPEGWIPTAVQDAYGGPLDETVHLAMMITNPRYEYWDAAEAARLRKKVMRSPWSERGLAGFASGVWSGCPPFQPAEVIPGKRGASVYRPEDRVAVADWSYRGREEVARWTAALPQNLRALVGREVARLKPIEVPEAKDVLDYWLGTTKRAPQLVVAFSGLGAAATQWVRQIGELAERLRVAASREQALTSVITGTTESWE